jgi:hypothetical protein
MFLHIGNRHRTVKMPVMYAATELQNVAGLADDIFSYQKWFYYGSPWNGKFWYVLWQFEIVYDYLEYFNAIW